MKRLLFTFIFFSITLGSYAFTNQQLETDAATINSQFFVAIIAGVLLALFFQVILTALSVAMGITMIGNVKQNYVDSKVNPSSSTNERDFKFDQDYNSSDTSAGVKISTAFGIWSLFTTAISLFGACALALNLSFFGSVASNITVALVIWALFFLILFYLEARIVNTIIGGLITTATSGLKTSANVIKGLFTKSENEKIESTIHSTIDKIRKEFDVNLNASELSGVLDNFFTKIDVKMPNYDTLKGNLEGIAKKSKNKNTAGKFMAIQQVLTKAIDKANVANDASSSGKTEELKTILAELKSTYTSDDSTVEGLKDIITEYTSLEKSQINDKINEVKAYLSKATPESFSNEKLNEDLNKILYDPKSAGAILSSKFKDFDKNRIVETLSQNTSLDKTQLKSYADSITSRIIKARKTIEDNDINTIKAGAEASISDFLSGTKRKELNYNDLKRDLNAILDNPKDSIFVIKSRLSKMDADTVKALVTNNKYIDDAHIDNVTKQINDSINTVKSKIASVEQKANKQFEIGKRKAVIQAEHARATAASAAWWLVIAVIISGGAAMLGAWIELF